MKHNSEEVLSYSISGMTIGAHLCGADGLIASVSLSDDMDEALTFMPEFFMHSTSGGSAREVWKINLRNFRVKYGAAMGYAMGRSYIKGERKLSGDVKDKLLAAMLNDGASECSLDNDEVHSVFDNIQEYLERLFSDRAFRSLIQDFAHNLQEQHKLSEHDVAYLLRQLR